MVLWNDYREMASKTLAYIVVVLWAILNNFGVNCARLSRKEDLELEKQLKLLNKPSAKTIKVKFIFDSRFNIAAPIVRNSYFTIFR